MSLKILLVGNGGREVALSRQISNDAEIYTYMEHKNPDLVEMSKIYKIGDILDNEKIKKFAIKNTIDIVMIGSETPLAGGLVDYLENYDLKCVGPSKSMTKLECNKSFCRNFLRDVDPNLNPNFWTFENEEPLERFFEKYKQKVAVKPVGLTKGKGVQVVGIQLNNNKEALSYAKKILREKIGGIQQVIIEEKMTGVEFTLHCITDGKNHFFFPATFDYPYRNENDFGLKTGGMGSYNLESNNLPFMTTTDYEECCKIIKKIINKINKGRSTKIKGILNVNFFLNQKTFRVCEINVRFGDPEAINLLSIYKTSWVDTMYHIVERSLAPNKIKIEHKSSIVTYFVPPEYPKSQRKKYLFSIDKEKIKKNNGEIYFAGTVFSKGRYLTTGSRAVAILSKGKTIENAKTKMEKCVKFVTDKLEYRNDIASQFDIKKNIMKRWGINNN